MIQDVHVIGATGRVGGALVRQIIEKDDVSYSRHENPTRIVGLASADYAIFSAEGISSDKAYAFINKNKDCDGAQKYQNLHDLLKIVRQNGKADAALVFVDVTPAGEPMAKFHLEVIEETPFGIVTANKNPLTLPPYAVFHRLTKYPKRYGYRCSVMAGAESVPFLQDLRDLNDRLFTIDGCLSGTICYITSELEKSKPFSKIVREARQKGYTEPHPKDDLTGLDVAKKLCILARTAGYRVNMEDIKLIPLIPQKFLSENNVDRFLNDMESLDQEFAERMSRAKRNGKTLRYIARMDARGEIPKLEVSLEEVPQDGSLGCLRGTKNKIVITSEAYPDGYSIESIGAGLNVTARNIRRDLLYLLPQRCL